MFCSQCGTENNAEARYCQKCGASLSSVGAQQNRTISEAASSQSNAIWNPNATVNWSFVFTPAFGAYLQMLNWNALGQFDKAASSQNWFYASLAIPVVYLLMVAFSTDHQDADVAGRGLFFLFALVWYFSSGKEQGKYVKEKFGPNYSKKSWGKALLIGIAASISYVIFAAVVGDIVGAAGIWQNKNKVVLGAAPASTMALKPFYGELDKQAAAQNNSYLAADADSTVPRKDVGFGDFADLVPLYQTLQQAQDASQIQLVVPGDNGSYNYFRNGIPITLMPGEPMPDDVAQFLARSQQMDVLRNGQPLAPAPQQP